MKIVAVLDACVLFPASIRDFFMSLAHAEAFQPKWSETIHDEWITNLLKTRKDISKQSLERTRELMNAHVLDANVSGFEHLISGLNLPDKKDNHVLAAAIESSSDFIVTFNLRDFPKNVLSKWQIASLHPDLFVLLLLRTHPALVVEAFEAQRQRLQNPAKSKEELADILEKAGLASSMNEIRRLNT